MPDYDWAWGSEGYVRMRLQIEPTGAVSSVELVRPSGSAALDEALDVAIRGRTFAPCALDVEGGQPSCCDSFER